VSLVHAITSIWQFHQCHKRFHYRGLENGTEEHAAEMPSLGQDSDPMKFGLERMLAQVPVFDFPRAVSSAGERRAADLIAEELERIGWRVEWIEVPSRFTSTWFNLAVFCAVFPPFVMVAWWLVRFLPHFVPLSAVLIGVWAAAWTLFPEVALTAAIWLDRRLQPFLWAFPTTLFGMKVAAWSTGGDEIASRLERILMFLWIAAVPTLAIVALWTRRSLPVIDKAGWSTERSDRSVDVWAQASTAAEAPVRVLFLTHLDTAWPRVVWLGWLMGIGFVVLAVVHAVAWCAGARSFAAGVELVFCLFAIAVFLLLVVEWSRPKRPYPGDNRTGLALLLEFARALPERIHDQVEIRLAAVGAHTLRQRGAWALALSALGRWEARPTLVINFDAPGLGPELALVGWGPAIRVARDASRDLWIPHRVAWWPLAALDHRPFALCGIPSVSLAGDRRAETIDPARLAAAAQLAVEIALRWARQHRAE
jgi:hypothetical protein